MVIDAEGSSDESAAPAQTKASKRAVQKKKPLVISDSSESEEEVAPDPTPRPTRSRRGGKRVVYNVESPELDDSYVEPEEMHGDSESDFQDEDEGNDDDSDWE